MPESMNRLASVAIFATVLLLPLGVVALSPSNQPSSPLPPAVILASPPAPAIELRPVAVPGTDSVPHLSFVDKLRGCEFRLRDRWRVQRRVWLTGEYVLLLNDETLALYEGQAVLLGIGSGAERSWVRVLP